MNNSHGGVNRHRADKTAGIAYAGMTAALYTLLTLLSDLFGLAYGPVQIRLSEALCVLPTFSPYAISGLTVGCVISGLISGALPADILFGSVVTLLGAVGTRLLRKKRYLCCLPPVIANGAAIPFLLINVYGVNIAYPLLLLSITAGESVSVFLLGQLLYAALRGNGGRIFKGRR